MDRTRGRAPAGEGCGARDLRPGEGAAARLQAGPQKLRGPRGQGSRRRGRRLSVTVPPGQRNGKARSPLTRHPPGPARAAGRALHDPRRARSLPDPLPGPGRGSESARWDLSYFVRPDRRRKVRYFPPSGGDGRGGVGGGGGRGTGPRCAEAASRCPQLLGPAPGFPFRPPPCTYPEVKSCCTLSSRSRRVSSIIAAASTSPPLTPPPPPSAPRRHPAAPVTARPEPSRPAPPPARSGLRAAAPSAFPPPARALPPRPRRAQARAAAVSPAGLGLRKRGGPSLPAEKLSGSGAFS